MDKRQRIQGRTKQQGRLSETIKIHTIKIHR